jgi:predicted small secreted protein
MRSLLPTLLLLATTTLAACGADDGDGGDGDSSLTIVNDSSFTFDNIYLSPVDQDDWGADLLGADLLDPGDEVVITDLVCDVFDIRIVDEDGDECIVTDVDLCFDDALWVIDDDELASCQF